MAKHAVMKLISSHDRLYNVPLGVFMGGGMHERLMKLNIERLAWLSIENPYAGLLEDLTSLGVDHLDTGT